MRHPDPFLAAHGYAGAERLPLPADASLRHYTRLIGGPRPALLRRRPDLREAERRPAAATARETFTPLPPGSMRSPVARTTSPRWSAAST